MLLLSSFGALPALLSIVGHSAVLPLAVARRVGEWGIRRALGAPRADVVRWVLRSGLRLIGIGTAVGALAAWATSRTLSSMLFDVRPGDPLTDALVIAAPAAVGLAACWAPARRAGRVDPVESLQDA
jgi:ABC-type lipoprotein release transport system permease subunit